MSNRLGHTFSKKEGIIILILALLLIGMLYYRFVYMNMQSQIKAYDTTELEDDIALEEMTAAQIASMRQAIEEEDETGNALVAVYSNQKNELNALNDILSNADDFTVNFSTPEAEDKLVRRDATITFYAEDYATAEKIISLTENCEYFCIIKQVNLDSAISSSSMETGAVRGSMTLTFYETLYGADTEVGLSD